MVRFATRQGVLALIDIYKGGHNEWRQMATNGSRWRMMVSAALMMVMSNGVMAQNNPLPWENITEPAAYVIFGVAESEWKLYPVITANDDFIGFFGYLPDEFVVGNNVSLLWLIPDNGDGTWSMYGWSNTDLKVVSDYLDNLAGTSNVLADTGLDIFSGGSQPIVQPKSMPNGISIDDPAAPIMAATQDPAIASALIAAGAAGAPNLTEATNIQPVDDCLAINAGDNFSELDMTLAYYARTVQEMMVLWVSDEILDSLASTGFDQDIETLRTCFPCGLPGVFWACNRWSLWSCTGGPVLAGTVCSYTGCTRSRTCAVTVTVYPTWSTCYTTSFTFTMNQGPRAMTAPALPGGGCPPGP